MAFLNKIRNRQAVMAKADGKCNHQPHMGTGELVQGIFIALRLPTHRQISFFVAVEKRC